MFQNIFRGEVVLTTTYLIHRMAQEFSNLIFQYHFFYKHIPVFLVISSLPLRMFRCSAFVQIQPQNIFRCSAFCTNQPRWLLIDHSIMSKNCDPDFQFPHSIRFSSSRLGIFIFQIHLHQRLLKNSNHKISLNVVLLYKSTKVTLDQPLH